MAAEAQLSQGMASNMIQGEPPTPVVTNNGVMKMSCIDPKNKNNLLDGFQLPASMGKNVGDGQCMGAEVIYTIMFIIVGGGGYQVFKNPFLENQRSSIELFQRFLVFKK